MVDLLAAAGLQLRLHAGRPRHRRLVGHEEARLRASARRASSRSTCRRTPAPASSSPASPPRCGFGLIWYIWWLAALSFVALLAVAIGHTFNYNRDFYIPAEDVVRTESRAHAQLLAAEPELMHDGRLPTPARDRRAGLLRRRGARRTPKARHLARLLDLPDERLPHLRGPVRHLRRARPQLCRRARRRRTCSTCRWSRSTPRCCCCPPSPTASPCWTMEQGPDRRRRRCGWRSPACSALAFVGIELTEFAHMIHEGATPQRSAFLSSFFTLVGTHGLHVTCRHRSGW